jgi:hypothetical protein
VFPAGQGPRSSTPFTVDAKTGASRIPKANTSCASGCRGSRQQDGLRHAGRTVRPRRGKAHWFNARHDGITLRRWATILTAANPNADKAPWNPAVVNHVVISAMGSAQNGLPRLQGHRSKQLHDRIRREVTHRVG